VCIKETVEFTLPIAGAFVDVPRMIPETRQHLRMRLGQCSDLGPILLCTAIDHHPRKPLALGQEFSLSAGKTFGLQMIVGVE
jgi:hypothetical protein